MDRTPSGVIKINVDVALSKNVSMASAATIARDEDGRFMGASALVLRGIVDPEVMESIACREGMALVADLQADSFRLANDCLNVVKSIRQGDLGMNRQVIREINARKAAFSSVEFAHEHRDSNTDAHRIARSSIHAKVAWHVWFLNPPDGVCNMYNPIWIKRVVLLKNQPVRLVVFGL